MRRITLAAMALAVSAAAPAFGQYTFTTLGGNPSSTNAVGNNFYNPLLLSGGVLYGDTYDGGTSGGGTSFSMPVTGGSPTLLVAFDGTNGLNPLTSLIMDSSGNLYGATPDEGPTGDNGTIFELALPEPASIGLLAFGSIVLCARRRRSRLDSSNLGSLKTSKSWGAAFK